MNEHIESGINYKRESANRVFFPKLTCQTLGDGRESEFQMFSE